jgi:glycosyltransferase involved in cell wall biosynthesis
MPVYNGERTLARTIGSVLRQTYADLELVIIDDGSTDRTREIIAGIADPRIRSFSFPNAGPSAARNRGIGAARAALIAFIDADDLWSRDKLERQVAALGDQPQAALAYSWTDCVDEHDGFLHHGSHVRVDGPPYEALVLRNFIDNGSAPLVRRTALEAAGLFDESLRNAEDWDLWLRIGHEHTFACVPSVHVLYRVAPGSGSSSVERQAESALLVLERALARLPEGARRNRLRRAAQANICRYVALRLCETARDRATGRTALRYWWRFVRTTPTPLRTCPRRCWCSPRPPRCWCCRRRGSPGFAAGSPRLPDGAGANPCCPRSSEPALLDDGNALCQHDGPWPRGIEAVTSAADSP